MFRRLQNLQRLRRPPLSLRDISPTWGGIGWRMPRRLSRKKGLKARQMFPTRKRLRPLKLPVPSNPNRKNSTTIFKRSNRSNLLILKRM
ncbi:hypothetical protein Rhsp01_60140 [Rhizobium sp. NBRC 114257]|uniref:Uncharacterized protein n=1 Tax=Rhizobium dioscoreae TaxID=2653122 RepID=A0ABQ0ZDF3_9HYPH|nr:hypothetical protein RsS93_59600 [Rhizobium dioscoreae]GLU84838.1 hypothetical protein Rhsp01_60140 [Rhizobium sp. NBRC 114257]